MRPYRPLPSRSGPNDGNVPYSRARGRPLLQQATLGGTTNSTPGISPVVAAGTNAAGGKCTGRALRLGCCCLGRSCLLPLLGLALVLGCQVLRPHDLWGTHAHAHTHRHARPHTHTPNQREMASIAATHLDTRNLQETCKAIQDTSTMHATTTQKHNNQQEVKMDS